MPFNSAKIKDFRNQLNLTQSELAMVLGVPQSTIARWETQKTVPNAFHIGLMCDFGHTKGIEPGFFFPNFSDLQNNKGQ